MGQGHELLGGVLRHVGQLDIELDGEAEGALAERADVDVGGDGRAVDGLRVAVAGGGGAQRVGEAG